jgi:indole-3-glycerol phosphate synthase/phosphoribosylanthranilate isomerase
VPETFLDRIVATTRSDLADRQAQISLDELRGRATAAPSPRHSRSTLRPAPAGSARLIAEIKRASPSKGVIAEHVDPVAQARAYEQGGASAVSVLTEPHFFRGSLDQLRAVRAAVDLPVLRKDFILDPYQVYEARAAGADALLLICSLLDDAQLTDLLALTRSLGMEALVEAHDAAEVCRAVAADATIIGVNSRDLRTFAVGPDIVRHLRPMVPGDRVFVAESGIATATDAARARAWGADAILVGESLMRAADPAAKARELATAGGGPVAAFFADSPTPVVKMCGLNSSEQITHANRCGADAYGLVFAPMAPDHRRVTVDHAEEFVRQARASLDCRDVVEQGLAATFGPRGSMRTIGVFVNEAPARIAEIAEHIGLDAIQLSGDETPVHCALVSQLTNRPILKALRLRDEAELARLDAYATADAIPLLDAHVPGSYGGAGVVGDWDLARRAAQRWPIILSGGLTPDNVAEAITIVQPRGVDVSSGVETNRAKDPDKIRAFVTAVRAATEKRG